VTFQGAWKAQLDRDLNPADMIPNSLLPVIYDPERPHRSILLYNLPQTMGKNMSMVKIRVSKDGKLLDERLIAGWISVGSASDDTVVLSHDGVLPGHILISSKGSVTRLERTAGGVRVNGSVWKGDRT